MLATLLAAALVMSQPAPAAPHAPDRVPALHTLAEGVPTQVQNVADTALARYVSEDDGQFRWDVVRTIEQDGLRIFQIRLTSQVWRTADEVSEPTWTHWLTVSVPTRIRSDVPIFIIGGGRRQPAPREKFPDEFLLLAKGSQAIVAYLDNVPNQPLRFTGDTEDRFEDAILAATWNFALDHDDVRWIGRFPMVKAAKRGMDALQQFCAKTDLTGVSLAGKPLPAGFSPTRFFVTGASKRGWTTWLIAAVDARVMAIAPMVIDVLNIQASTRHHFASYGFWSPALRDYVDNKIVDRFGDPGLAKVLVHEDPAAYLGWLERLPKYVITASGDQFFPSDSAQFYEKLLPGTWRLRTHPNTAHNLRGSNVLFETLAFYRLVTAGQPLPELAWTPSPTGDSLHVTTSVAPLQAVLWQCDNTEARDFRLETTGPAWTSTPVTFGPGNAVDVPLPAPDKGWRAYFVECTYAGGGPTEPPFACTTRVFIRPDTLPFADKLPAP